MPIFRLFFAAAGRMRPGPFAVAIIFVYALGAAAQMLTTPAVLARAGLWPFALVQALLLWVWFALHAKRLRDAGRGSGSAQGIAVIYALAVVLLVFVAAFFLDAAAQTGRSGSAVPTSRILALYLLNLFRGPTDPVTFLVLIACVSVVIAPAFSVWAATRPSASVEQPAS